MSDTIPRAVTPFSANVAAGSDPGPSLGAADALRRNPSGEPSDGPPLKAGGRHGDPAGVQLSLPIHPPGGPTATTEIPPMLVHDQATPLAQKRTPEGFLHIKARIGRAGLQDYKAGEIGGPAGAPHEANVRVYRPPEEVFDPASLASFAGKPVTLEHPPAMVDSGNWKQFAVGHSGGSVTRDGDHIATDLVVTDAAAVDKARAGSELSNGYWADFDFTPGLTPEGEPYDAVQRKIRGNHIALVDQGRCGPSCTVGATGAGAVTAGSDAAAVDSLGAQGRVPTAATSVLDCPPGEAAAELSRLRSEIEARDGEIAALKARAAADAASLDRRAAERARTIDVARNLLGAGFDPTGLDLGVDPPHRRRQGARPGRRARPRRRLRGGGLRHGRGARHGPSIASGLTKHEPPGGPSRGRFGRRRQPGHRPPGSQCLSGRRLETRPHPRRPLMPAVQTSYPMFQSPAYLGMMANGEWVTNVISRVVDPAATVPVNFGDPVLQGASEQTVVSANGGTGVFRGIAIRDATLPPTANDQYAATMTVGVVTKGVVWVNATVAVSPGQPAFFTAAGLLTTVATGNTAIVGALWESATTGAGLAKLRLG